MVKNEILDATLDELKQHGVEATVAYGTKHIQVRWYNRLDQPRMLPISRSGSSERHAIQNHRRDVRRILRDDCMLPEQPTTAPAPTRQPSKIEQLEHALQMLNNRIARVEQLIKSQTP